MLSLFLKTHSGIARMMCRHSVTCCRGAACCALIIGQGKPCPYVEGLGVRNSLLPHLSAESQWHSFSGK
jgi:hypothetical protein